MPNHEQRRRIAFFSNNLELGGVQKSLVNLLNELDYSRYSVDLYITNRKNFFQKSIPREVNVIMIKPISRVMKLAPFSLAKYFYKSRFKFPSYTYNVAIDFDGYQHLTALGAIYASADKRVTWFHGNHIKRMQSDWLYKLAWYVQRSKYKLFDSAVAVSKGLVPIIKQSTPFDDDSKITVINNFIDTDEIYKLASENVSLQSPKGEYRLISVCRLAREKGVDITLKTFKDVLNQRTDIHLYIIGDGPDRKKLERLAANLHISDKVTFLGAQKNPYKYMAAADGLISTARNEGQGISALEAKSLGLDVFIPRDLEAFSYKISGSDNLVKAIVEAQQSKKLRDSLHDYNSDVLSGFHRLTETVTNKSFEIFNVGISTLSKGQTIHAIEDIATQKTPKYITTTNPEFLVEANKDHNFKNILQNSAHNTADGIGVVWAAKFLSLETINFPLIRELQIIFQFLLSLPLTYLAPKWVHGVVRERASGSVIFWDIAQIAEKHNLSIYLLGGYGDTVDIVKSSLLKKYPKLNIAGTSNARIDDVDIAKTIASIQPDILLVAFGGIRQEKWIHKNYRKIGASLSVGLGGTFDYVANKQPYPHPLIRRLGLEWAYRLITQPHRYKRIYTATVVFPANVLLSKLRKRR